MDEIFLRNIGAGGQEHSSVVGRLPKVHEAESSIKQMWCCKAVILTLEGGSRSLKELVQVYPSLRPAWVVWGLVAERGKGRKEGRKAEKKEGKGKRAGKVARRVKASATKAGWPGLDESLDSTVGVRESVPHLSFVLSSLSSLSLFSLSLSVSLTYRDI